MKKKIKFKERVFTELLSGSIFRVRLELDHSVDWN